MPSNPVLEELARRVTTLARAVEQLKTVQVPAPSAAAAPATSGAMTVSMTTSVVTITPTGACTFNASGGVAGQTCVFVITTGASGYGLTWSTNFKVTGTLTTVANKTYTVAFVCSNGTTWCEICRTTAM